MSFNGRVVLVTGGNRGIGRAVQRANALNLRLDRLERLDRYARTVPPG